MADSMGVGHDFVSHINNTNYSYLAISLEK